MNFEFMTIDTPLPPCMPFPRALTGFPVSSTAKVMYCRMLDAMLSKGKEDENGILFVCFPITAMLIVQDQTWNRVTINRAEKKATRYYMDEFHLLLKEEQTAAYSVEIWKRFRKWGGIPTAITQNVKDLLASREVENIFENSDFVLIFRICKFRHLYGLLELLYS